VAVVAVGDAVLAAATVADEVERDLHLLVEAQRFDLHDLRRALLGAARGRHVDGERHLRGKGGGRGKRQGTVGLFFWLLLHCLLLLLLYVPVQHFIRPYIKISITCTTNQQKTIHPPPRLTNYVPS